MKADISSHSADVKLSYEQSSEKKDKERKSKITYAGEAMLLAVLVLLNLWKTLQTFWSQFN